MIAAELKPGDVIEVYRHLFGIALPVEAEVTEAVRDTEAAPFGEEDEWRDVVRVTCVVDGVERTETWPADHEVHVLRRAVAT